MKIFLKLLILLLIIAVGPLATVGYYAYRKTGDLGSKLGSRMSTILKREARRDLLQLVNDTSNTIRAEGQLLELALRLQAKEAETRGMGRPEAMIPVYEALQDGYSNMVVRHYTALESGGLSMYPGNGAARAAFPDRSDPRKSSWYVEAKKHRRLVWNPPALDPERGTFLTTISMPVFGPDGSVAGVTGMDVSILKDLHLDSIPDNLRAETKLFLTYLDISTEMKDLALRIIGRKDQPEAGEDREAGGRVRAASLDPEREQWLESGDSQKYGRMIQEIIDRRSGVIQMPYKGRNSFWAFGLVGEANVALIIITPQEAIVSRAVEAREFISGQMADYVRYIAIFVLCMASMVVVVAYAASRSVSSPLQSLARATKEIATGNLEVELPRITSRDEISHLAECVASMKNDLKVYIKDLTETTAAKERIESELNIATDIQMSFLPKLFPPFPERSEFDLYATIDPAKEVGGDLYDFFLTDEDHLFFCIGDVSGKGVPAALFMSVTKTLTGAQKGLLDPARILERVNGDLCEKNDAMLFVTMFCGVLDIRTGELLYSNAGHNPPVLLRADGRAEWMTLPEGIVLGVMPEAVFTTSKIQLLPEDLLITYTDGVTEAFDPNQELYSEERLMRVISTCKAKSPSEAIQCIMDSVEAFAAGYPQSDDITMLALKYKSGKDGGDDA